MPTSINLPIVTAEVLTLKNSGLSNQAVYDELAPKYFDKKSLKAIIQQNLSDAQLQNLRPVINKLLAIQIALLLVLIIGGLYNYKLYKASTVEVKHWSKLLAFYLLPFIFILIEIIMLLFKKGRRALFSSTGSFVGTLWIGLLFTSDNYIQNYWFLFLMMGLTISYSIYHLWVATKLRKGEFNIFM
jgi:hypothetical protein